MAKISDEIRKWCGICRDSCIDEDDCDKLRALADRIDSEMVELPKDRDGVPIHVGDTVYMSNGRKVYVSGINIARDHTSINSGPRGNGPIFFSIEPTNFTHTRPDSWERIANELEELSVDSSDNYCVSTHCSKLADRIRKLAAKEDKQCH